MARFRYRMQSILDLKYKTEGQAKTEFGLARRALIEEENKLAALYERRERYLEESRRMRSESGALPVRDILLNDNFMERMDELIEEQKLAIQRAEEVVEEKRQILTVEIQERKMQERLRERAFEQYIADEKAAEYKELDERSSFVYGAGSRE